MRKLFLLLVLVLLAFGAWWFFFRASSGNSGPKQQPLKVGLHSTLFNQGIDNLVKEYLSLKEAFVNADTALIKAQQKKLTVALDSLKTEELKKDTTGIFQSARLMIGDIRSNAEAIAKESDITEMRQDFRMVSENLFPLLKTIHYEGQKLYWQNCPMAFGEGKDASWISNTEEIINPYLGRNHPEFKGTMLHCGEIKDTIQ